MWRGSLLAATASRARLPSVVRFNYRRAAIGRFEAGTVIAGAIHEVCMYVKFPDIQRNVTVLAVAASMLLTAAVARAEDTPTPEQATGFIQQLSDQALGILADTGQTLDGREQHVRDLMNQNVAIDFIARFALGKYWARASESERTEYTAVFRTFFLQKYAAMLGGYDNQVVTVEGAKPAGDKDMLVSTSIADSNGAPPIRASWRVRLFDSKPLIVDIVIEGISMAMNQRQEFSSVLSRGGLSGLMDVLRASTERVPAQAPA